MSVSRYGAWAMRMGLAVAALVATSFPEAAEAASIVWNGGTGVWGTGANWVGGVAPGSSDTATFSSSTTACSVASSVSVAAISISVGVTITQSAGVSVTTSGNFTQSAGTFVGASSGTSPISVGGTFSLSNGTFTSTSGLLNVGGAFNKISGTFNANGGQVMLSSTSNQAFATNGATFNNLTINDGLIGYWKLDDSSSPALDYSGYGNSLTWLNSATSSATVPSMSFADSKSISLSSVTRDAAQIALPSAVQVSLPITISAWYSATAVGGSGGEIVSAGDNYDLRILSTTATCSKYLGASSWIGVASSTLTAPLNGQFHHLACVMTTSGMTIYYDGQQVGSNVDGNPVVNATGGSHVLAIGRHGNGSASYDFSGKVDDVRIYNRALSQVQITTLASGHQAGSGTTAQTLSGSPTVTGDLAIASGTLSAGGNNLTVGGDWSNYGGMFIGSGTVTFNGSGSNVIRSAGQDFGAVTINGTGTWALEDRLSVAGGALTLTGGTLNTSGYTVRAGSIAKTSGTFTSTGSTLVIDGTSNATLPAITAGALRVEDPTETNLVAYWKLDNAQGTTFRDYSGSGNTGTLTGGASWVTSSMPSVGYDDPAALSLDGSSGYATMGVSNLPANNAAQTISLWAKLTNTTQGGNMIAVTNGSNSAIQLKIVAGTMGAYQWGGSALVTTPATTAGVWHHIAYTYDGASHQAFYIDGTATTATVANQTGTPTVAYLGTYAPNNEMFNGVLDDVRVYNTVLSATQIASLVAGRYPGTGGTSTVTLAGAITVDGALALDSGSLSTSTFNLTAANTSATLATVSAGTLTIGSGIVSLKGGGTFRSTGTLTMATGGGALAMGSGTTLTIDGTLNASSTTATIKSVSGTYTFEVGSTASATPTLNINGLTVKNTDSNGWLINGTPGGSSGAVTTFTEFDNIAFGSGTGNQLLNAYASSLYLSSNGCSFDSSTTYAIKLTSTAGSGTGPRLLFGKATCATNDPTTGLCAISEKQDNEDAAHDGLASPATGGVVEFVRAAASDTDGTLAGFPTAAFNWNTFTYYSTYVAFNNAVAGTGVIYVRDENGNPLYSWTDANLISGGHETVTGTPLWTTVGSTHYVYVAVNGSSANTGGVYRLIDTGTQNTSGTLTLDTSWPTATSTGYYPCSCTITSGAQLDANNVYWAATTSGGQMLFGITQTAGAVIKTGWPVTAPANVTSSAPVLVTATSSLYLGVTAKLAQLNFSTLAWTLDAPTGMGTINGRVNYGTAHTSLTTRIYVGDASGKLWGVNPSAFSGTNYLWSYAAGSAITDNYYDSFTDTVQFGTASGTVLSLTGAGSGTSGVVVNAGYPYTVPGADPITTAPLYYNGILVVGTTKGNLYFLNRNTGPGGSPANSVAILKAVNFGPTEAVSGIGFDSNVNRYMVSTSSAANDGRIYYFDLISDPDGTP